MISALLPIAKRAVRDWRAPALPAIHLPAVHLPVVHATALYLLVTGDSMAPTLRDGDWVIARRAGVAQAGDIVVAHRPGDGLQVVKRVARVTPTGYWLAGDNPDASTDSRHFGPVPRIVARLVWRVRPWGALPPLQGEVRTSPAGTLGI